MKKPTFDPLGFLLLTTNTILIRTLLFSTWLGAGIAQAQTPTAVLAWGNNDGNATVVPAAAQSGVTAVAAGGGNSVALRFDRTVVDWGRYYLGDTLLPDEVQGKVSAIAAGGVHPAYAHTVALLTNGSVVAWGSGGWGITTPPAGAQSGVTAIAAGTVVGLALKTNGSVLVWGGTITMGRRMCPRRHGAGCRRLQQEQVETTS